MSPLSHVRRVLTVRSVAPNVAEYLAEWDNVVFPEEINSSAPRSAIQGVVLTV